VFPGGGTPAQVVIQAPEVDDAGVRGAIDRLERDVLDSGRFSNPTKVDINQAGTVAVVSLPIASGNGTDEASNAALATLRDRLIPQTIGKLDGVTANVSGLTAQSKDYNDQMRARAPIVFAFVLAVAFLLLLVTFCSIVIPIKAIVLNLLSVGASYGVLVLVFQNGWFEPLLGLESTATIEAWLPVFLFVVLFGLSMDYQVFIVSRIREAFDRGKTTADAIEDGIKSTASVVTSAAVVMIAVFAIFASLRALMLKEMGVGLAVAVFIDATIVRAGAATGHHEAPRRLELVPAKAPPVAPEDPPRAQRRDRSSPGQSAS